MQLARVLGMFDELRGAGAPAKGDGRWRWVAVWWMICLGQTQAVAMAVLFPVFQSVAHLDRLSLGLVVGGYALTFAASSLFGATFLRPVSPALIMRACCFGLGFLNLLLWLHPDAWGFVVLRWAAAVPHGLVVPSAVAWVTRCWPGRGAFRVSGWILAGHAAGHALGVPLLLQVTGYAIDPRTAFAWLGIALLVGAGLLPRPVSDPEPPRDESPSWWVAWWEIWRLRSSRFLVLATFFASMAVSGLIVSIPLWWMELTAGVEHGLAGWVFASGCLQIATISGSGWIAQHLGLRTTWYSALSVSAMACLVLVGGNGSLFALGFGYCLLVGANGLRAAPTKVAMNQIVAHYSRLSAGSGLSAVHQLGRAAGAQLALLGLPGGRSTLFWTLVVVFLCIAGVLITATRALELGIVRRNGPALARQMRNEDVQ